MPGIRLHNYLLYLFRLISVSLSSVSRALYREKNTNVALLEIVIILNMNQFPHIFVWYVRIFYISINMFIVCFKGFNTTTNCAPLHNEIAELIIIYIMIMLNQ